MIRKGVDDGLVEVDALGKGAVLEIKAVIELSGSLVLGNAIHSNGMRELPSRIMGTRCSRAYDLMGASRQDTELDLIV